LIRFLVGNGLLDQLRNPFCIRLPPKFGLGVHAKHGTDVRQILGECLGNIIVDAKVDKTLQ
jgi:hypothetical protein